MYRIALLYGKFVTTQDWVLIPVVKEICVKLLISMYLVLLYNWSSSLFSVSHSLLVIGEMEIIRMLNWKAYKSFSL